MDEFGQPQITDNPALSNPVPETVTPPPVTHSRGSRTIKDIRFRPEQIGIETLEKIYKWYNDGIKIAIILRKVNPGRAEKQALSLVDIYAILNVGLVAKKIKQRSQPKEELSVANFIYIFEAWKTGLSGDAIRRVIGGKFGYSKNFFNGVIKSLNNRYKLECGDTVAAAISTHAAKVKNPADQSAVEILELGQRSQGVFDGKTEDVICIKVNSIQSAVIDRFRLICKELADKLFPVEKQSVVIINEHHQDATDIQQLPTVPELISAIQKPFLNLSGFAIPNEIAEAGTFGSIAAYRKEERVAEEKEELETEAPEIPTDQQDGNEDIDDDFDPEDYYKITTNKQELQDAAKLAVRHEPLSGNLFFREKFRDILKPENNAGEVLVAVHDIRSERTGRVTCEVVGYLALTEDRKTFPLGTSLLIVSLGVNPEFRRLGIASRLLDRTMNVDRKSVVAFVPHCYTEALQFFKKYGSRSRLVSPNEFVNIVEDDDFTKSHSSQYEIIKFSIDKAANH